MGNQQELDSPRCALRTKTSCHIGITRRYSTLKSVKELSGPFLLAMALLSAVPLGAQTLSSEEENEGKGREAELAFHFYPGGFSYSALDQSIGGGSDDLSFPFLDANFRYNAYEGGIAYRSTDNGLIFRLKSRYNLGLAKQSISKQSSFHIREYLYGGINLWHLNKKEIQYDYTKRPASKSTILGISMGGGIGFYLGTGLGLSIEPEYNYIPCPEDEDFFCGNWFDVKVGLEILFLLK